MARVQWCRRPRSSLDVRLAMIRQQESGDRGNCTGEARRSGFPASVLHPGHIVGPGWLPVNPGREISTHMYSRCWPAAKSWRCPTSAWKPCITCTPTTWLKRLCRRWCVEARPLARASTWCRPARHDLRGYAEAVAGWFGQQARLRFLPWDQWRATVTEVEASTTWDHIAHSPHCRFRQGRATTRLPSALPLLQAVCEAVHSLIARG